MWNWCVRKLCRDCLLLACLVAGAPTALAQGGLAMVPKGAELIEHELLDSNAAMYRLGTRAYVQVNTSGEQGQVKLPRLCASLRDVYWLADGDSTPHQDSRYELELKPEPDYWQISWKETSAQASVIVLEFEQPPQLVSELQPIKSRGDGSFVLRADQARTTGEKIRYEPQTFKNTVGYWVGKNDSATWSIQVVKPGEFNVAILQGCGRGQGGSTAALQLLRDDQLIRQIEFTVLETGHFQNFHWRTLETMAIDEPGEYQLRIVPVEVKRAALMDVRQVHLVRLPN